MTTTAILCPKSPLWENSFHKQIEQLRNEHPSLVLTPVNIEQLQYFCTESKNKDITGVIIIKEYTCSCMPFYGNEKKFREEYPEGTIWHARKIPKAETVEAE